MKEQVMFTGQDVPRWEKVPWELALPTIANKRS